jgi:hypothetical protein
MALWPSGFPREQDAQLATHGFVEQTISWKNAVNGVERVHEAFRRRQWARRIQPLDLLDVTSSSFQGGPEFMGRHERGELWCIR